MKLTLIVTALLAAGSCFAQAQDQRPIDPNRVVAVVNGQEIKGAEYYHRMEFLNGVGTLIGQRLVQFPPGLLTLDRLISERLTLQLADQKGVTPKDSEVDAYYREQLTANPNMERDWTSSGRTVDELKYNFRIQLAEFNVQTAGINITDQEVQKDYDDNKATLYTTPKLAELKVIVVGDSGDEAKVDSELKGGKAFEDVAKELSIDVSKAGGANFGTLPIESLPDPIKTALATTKIGQTTDWIKAPGQDATGTAMMKLLYVNAIEPKTHALDDEMKTRIRRKLMLQKGAVQNDVSKEIAQLRASAKVDIKDPVFAEAYKELQQRQAGVGVPPVGSGSKGS